MMHTGILISNLSDKLNVVLFSVSSWNRSYNLQDTHERWQRYKHTYPWKIEEPFCMPLVEVIDPLLTWDELPAELVSPTCTDEMLASARRSKKLDQPLVDDPWSLENDPWFRDGGIVLNSIPSSSIP